MEDESGMGEGGGGVGDVSGGDADGGGLGRVSSEGGLHVRGMTTARSSAECKTRIWANCSVCARITAARPRATRRRSGRFDMVDLERMCGRARRDETRTGRVSR